MLRIVTSNADIENVGIKKTKKGNADCVYEKNSDVELKRSMVSEH